MRGAAVNLSEINAGIEEAKQTLRNADSVATKLAQMLVGRLRKVQWEDYLRDLKRELAKFNIQTGQWRD
jgi:hypothetical protein